MANKETSIGIKLVTDLRQYQDGLNKAQKQGKQFTGGMQKSFGGLTDMLKGAALAAGAMFAADKIMDAAKAVFDYAKEISNTKIAVETLAGVHGAANNGTKKETNH